jgi:S1-C subfamily serine protease
MGFNIQGMQAIHRHIIRVFALILMAAPAACRADAPEVFRATLPATVWVVDSVHGSSGSGVVIDINRRLIVTAAHVVEGSKDVMIFFPAFNSAGKLIDDRKVYLKAENLRVLAARRYEATGHVIAVNGTHDLALIQVRNLSRTARALALATTAPERGDPLYFVGHPANRPLWSCALGELDRIETLEWKPEGSLQPLHASAVVFYGQVWNGNSGGPVVNARHELVGILSSGDLRLKGVAIDGQEIAALVQSVNNVAVDQAAALNAVAGDGRAAD